MIKSRPCTVEGCSQPRWAKGFCKKHQSLRTDKKPKGIRKISEKGKINRDIKKDLIQNDMSFYLSLWLKRPHICYNCGKNLGVKPLTYYFDHILEKGTRAYEHLRHEEQNICFLCLDCHTNKSLIPKLVELREDTKKLFGVD